MHNGGSGTLTELLRINRQAMMRVVPMIVIMVKGEEDMRENHVRCRFQRQISSVGHIQIGVKVELALKCVWNHHSGVVLPANFLSYFAC